MCSRDGYGEFHLFGCDHKVRMEVGYGIPKFRDHFENCGGHIP